MILHLCHHPKAARVRALSVLSSLCTALGALPNNRQCVTHCLTCFELYGVELGYTVCFLCKRSFKISSDPWFPRSTSLLLQLCCCQKTPRSHPGSQLWSIHSYRWRLLAAATSVTPGAPVALQTPRHQGSRPRCALAFSGL